MNYSFAGRHRNLTFGRYPAVPLVGARRNRDDAKQGLAEPAAGDDLVDPALLFETVAREWFDTKRSGWCEGHAARVWSRVERDILSTLGRRIAAEIRPTEVLAALRAVEARGAIDVRDIVAMTENGGTEPVRKVRRKGKTIAAPEFAERMQLACDGNPDVPQINYGRLGWVQQKFADRGATISPETVRRWFAGEARPRHVKLMMLAEILQVDQAWLALGVRSDVSDRQRRVRSSAASGAASLIAGYIQMAGGTPAFPDTEDARALAQKIDVYAIIKGAQYAIHVVVGEKVAGGWRFVVPSASLETLVVGVLPTGPFAVDLVELDREGLESEGSRKSGAVEVTVTDALMSGGHQWRGIKTFSERL